MSTLEARQVTLRDGRAATVRTAMPSDASRCIQYMEALLPECDHLNMLPGEFDMTVDQERAWLKGHLDSYSSLIVVAEAGDEVVALANLDGHDNRRRLAHNATLGISIRKAWRGAGLGTAVMRAILDWAAAHPVIERVGLSVEEPNAAAVALYQKLGFVEEGRKVRAARLPDGGYADDIRMVKFVK